MQFTFEKKQMKLKIREAQVGDVRFIAESVLDAVGIEQLNLSLIGMTERLCLRDDTLYSWRNTLIAEEGNAGAVGSLTAYEGSRYLAMKTLTFSLVKEMGGPDFTDMDLESLPGEFYLDSLSVRPFFRGHGVGTALLKAGLEKGWLLGCERVTLACDPQNRSAYRLYTSLGFQYVSELFVFGEIYWKMEINNK